MSDYSSIESSAGLRVARCQLHGVLVRVFGIGVLMTGESGTGKTACAIELLRRGHALVADDAVQIFQRGVEIFGTAPETTRSLVHVRGVGIADVTSVVAGSVPLDECRIDMHVAMSDSDSTPNLGIPSFRIEAGPPGTVADQIESVARDHGR